MFSTLVMLRLRPLLCKRVILSKPLGYRQRLVFRLPGAFVFGSSCAPKVLHASTPYDVLIDFWPFAVEFYSRLGESGLLNPPTRFIY